MIWLWMSVLDLACDLIGNVVGGSLCSLFPPGFETQQQLRRWYCCGPLGRHFTCQTYSSAISKSLKCLLLVLGVWNRFIVNVPPPLPRPLNSFPARVVVVCNVVLEFPRIMVLSVFNIRTKVLHDRGSSVLHGCHDTHEPLSTNYWPHILKGSHTGSGTLLRAGVWCSEVRWGGKSV